MIDDRLKRGERLFHRAQDQRDGAQVFAKIFKIVSRTNISIIISNIISSVWKPQKPISTTQGLLQEMSELVGALLASAR